LGVDVPLPDAEGKKLYVWLDAPIGYVSSTKQWAKENGKDWEIYWKKQADPADDSRLIHFIGKDNIVFHCIIFPSILHARGDYLVPDNVPANEFLNLEGEKMSTSRNYAVWLHEYLDEFPDKQDVLRYVLCSIMPETKDSDFSWKDFQARNNNELLAIFGNFVNRVVVLTQKYYDGIVPEPKGKVNQAAIDEAFAQIDGHIAKCEQALENFRFREAQAEFMNVARVGNKYLTDEEPWKKWKTDPDSVPAPMFTATQIVAKLALLAKVFLPFTAEKVFDLLKIDGSAWDWDKVKDEVLVPAGHQVFADGKAPHLFQRIEDAAVEAQLDKLKNALKPNPKAKAAKEEVSFDDFQKMDIRIGTILEASRVPKADKLLQFKVDTGIDVRSIVSGVAEHFEPEELVGKQVQVLVNLKPRKIRGVVSQGMILYAEDSTGKLHLVSTVQDLETGSEVN
jgi:methionyl-tRNA synthetase